jgi:hypothetical protein
MLRRIRCCLGVVTILLGFACVLPAADEPKDELVANPLYEGWASFKKGASVTHEEIVHYKGDAPEGKYLPDNKDHKTIIYKLLNVDDKKAIVQTVVHDHEFLSVIESAPTKHIYPAKVKKNHLELVREKLDAKTGEDEIEVGGKKYQCKTIEFTRKGDGEETHTKIWRSSDVPGGTVKRWATTKRGDKVVSEALIEMTKYSLEPKAKKDAPKENKE